MKVQIWRVLSQILFYRNDLIETIKPFFKNLKNENINDEKYIPLLKTFSKDHLEALYHNGIITEEKYNLIIPKNQKENQSSTKETNITENDINRKIEEIISGDKIKKLDKLLQEKDIITFNTITKSFLEVEKMKIPLIQYCIMKNAIECFKYLLVNGFDDPNKTMDEQNPGYFYDNTIHQFIYIKQYEWDCMATAIYFGNKAIVKILEVRGIEKGKNPTHIEASLLSYRNLIAKEIIEDLNENKEQIQNILNLSLRTSAKNNNIKGVKFLMTKGADINARDIIYLNIILLFYIKRILNK